MPDNEWMLPQLPPFPVFLEALPGNWTWIAIGAVLAVFALWALRRTKRVVLAATVAVAGLVAAWNAGFLPLTS